MKRYNTDDEFISMYAKEMGCTRDEALEHISAFIDCLKKCIKINNQVNIRKLGLFQINARKNSLVRNPFTGERQRLPLMYMIKFSAAKSFRAEINAKAKEQIRKFREHDK